MPTNYSVPDPVPVASLSTSHFGNNVIMSQYAQQPTQLPHPSIPVLYQKATSAFLLRQYDTAYTTCVEGLEALANKNHNTHDPGQLVLMRQRLWVLYVTIVGATMVEGDLRTKNGTAEKNHKNGFAEKALNFLSLLKRESPEKIVQDVWAKVTAGFDGVDGDVDGEVVVACVLLALNQALPQLARNIIEAWLSSLPETFHIQLEAATADHAANPSAPKDATLVTYERVIELYVLHVLPRLKEWQYAQEFLEDNVIIAAARKKGYLQAIQKLHERSLKPPRSKKSRRANSSSSVESAKSIKSNNGTNMSKDNQQALLYPQTELNGNIQPNNVSPITPVSSTILNGAAHRHTNGITTPNRSPSPRPPSASRVQKSLQTRRSDSMVTSTLSRLPELIQQYIQHLANGASSARFMALMLVFMIIAAISRRQQVWSAAKTVLFKLFQTIRMGTSLTYL